MLLKLRQGNDVRLDKIESARRDLLGATLDMEDKLDRALDIMIDELEAEAVESPVANPICVTLSLQKFNVMRPRPCGSE